MAESDNPTASPHETPESRLQALGIHLPAPATPVANYVPWVITGSLLVISGQICFGTDGKLHPDHQGKLGANVSLEQGQQAARLCAIQLLAQARAALGDLSRVQACVRLGGFVNVVPDYGPIPQVINGASDLMVAVLGERGRHARYAVGVAQLPLDAAVEIEALFEIA